MISVFLDYSQCVFFVCIFPYGTVAQHSPNNFSYCPSFIMMGYGSIKRNRKLSLELQSSHVIKKRKKKVCVDT